MNRTSGTLLVAEEPNDHYNNRNEKHEQRYTVHAMHKFYIDVFRIVWVALADVKVSEYLLPDSLFHSSTDLNKVTKNLVESLYLQPCKGN